jgi:hypothetical protein
LSAGSSPFASYASGCGLGVGSEAQSSAAVKQRKLAGTGTRRLPRRRGLIRPSCTPGVQPGGLPGVLHAWCATSKAYPRSARLPCNLEGYGAFCPPAVQPGALPAAGCTPGVQTGPSGRKRTSRVQGWETSRPQCTPGVHRVRRPAGMHAGSASGAAPARPQPPAATPRAIKSS